MISGEDFVRGARVSKGEKKSRSLDLYYEQPELAQKSFDFDVIKIISEPRKPKRKEARENFAEDGLYVSKDGPLTRNLIKPYHLDQTYVPETVSKTKFQGKLLELVIREITVHSSTAPQIVLLSILHKQKPVCKVNAPFDNKLHRLLLRDNSEPNSLSIEVQTQEGNLSELPLPLPSCCVKDKNIEIDFAINDSQGNVYSCTMKCSVNLTAQNYEEKVKPNSYLYRPTMDPNDPQNSFTLIDSIKKTKRGRVKYFQLEDPALRIEDKLDIPLRERIATKVPDVVVNEEPAFSILDLPISDWFQTNPMTPMSVAQGFNKLQLGRKKMLTVTVLRGAEIPLREESATVQPILEVEWHNKIQTTSVGDGPAPVWQHTLQFDLPRQNRDDILKLRLYDQHPVWGMQWLGEARVPMDSDSNYQEFEKWIGLCSMNNPLMLFGYVQASPVKPYTRVYVLTRTDQPGSSQPFDMSAMEGVCRNIQRCMAVPYKIVDVEEPEEIMQIVMLLSSLPAHYGPLAPRQALKLKKVDHHGRAALLATLLQGFGFNAYVLLGSSQTRKHAAFVMCCEDNNDYVLFSPEEGECYSLGDSRCSLISVSCLINHDNVWENIQAVSNICNLRFDTRSSKDWRPLTFTVTQSSPKPVQIIDLTDDSCGDEESEDLAERIESFLKEKMSEWRSEEGLTTVYNWHAVKILREFLRKTAASASLQPDKKDLRQLFRGYHTHGFVLNLRNEGLDDLAQSLASTKVHCVAGPVEFALVCHVRQYVRKLNSVLLAVAVLRSRD